MATFRKRGGKWQVQVRRDGFPHLSRSFISLADAREWARDTERSIDRADLPANVADLNGVTLAALLVRYRDSITPTKKGAAIETCRIRQILAAEIAGLSIAKLTPAVLARYRDRRLQLVKGGTVRREFALIRHCLEIARKEWDLPLSRNPVDQIRLPDESRPRDRRLSPDEARSLLATLDRSCLWYLKPIVLLAIETGMRRGELLSLVWSDLDREGRTIHIRQTKNGHPRTVPLTPMAIDIIEALPRSDVRLFPLTGNAVRLAWQRARDRAGLHDLRFHDLRHEAVSRFFELGLSVPEVALISGHRDTRMLGRYTHLRPATVAAKLKHLTRRQL